MASVYILFSKKLNNYYVGSCVNLDERIAEHKNKKYENSYTSKADDWELYYNLDGLNYNQARAIEKHIKKMESKKYEEISIKLIDLYKNNGKLIKY